METHLIREFEELEGLGEQFMDDSASLGDEKVEEDATMKPAQASNLQSSDLFSEVGKRNLFYVAIILR